MSGPGSELREGVGSSPLAAGLRELRGRTGLSLAGLAARTPYSKSSWERYLNGKKLPPRDAVEALCRLAEEPAGRLLALWELADADWSGRGRSGTGRGRGAADAARTGSARGTVSAPDAAVIAEAVPPVETVPEAAPRAAAVPRAEGGGPQAVPGRKRPPRRGVAVMAGACVGVLAVVMVLAFREAEGSPSEGAVPGASETTGCRGAACDGKDPESMYCDRPEQLVTPAERTAAGGEHLQIRYGTVCGAVWGRLRNGRVGDRIEVSAPGARPRSVRVRDRFDAEGYLVTPMAAARRPEGTRLCLYPAGGGAGECFTG
ncbi:XRE family transcriptional regulator [Streptomyces sp. ISID311]|uniref:helix-turn-helix domain-containing protein n=1 Tax=Streptomyces sp. ISID311 TaxID=2601673 RepID=UPI0021C467F4|nr:XRE family transcriptional regulator [Streptomyces sp. ISID311]